MSSSARPGPVSSTRRTPGAATTRTSPPGGVRRSAFSTRFDTTWRTRSASRTAGDRVQLDAEALRLLLVAADGVLDHVGEVDLGVEHAEIGAIHPGEIEQ